MGDSMTGSAEQPFHDGILCPNPNGLEGWNYHPDGVHTLGQYNTGTCPLCTSYYQRWLIANDRVSSAADSYFTDLKQMWDLDQVVDAEEVDQCLRELREWVNP